MTTHTINLADERPTLSPEWLREVAAKPNAVILVAEPKLSMLADGLEIADKSAWCLIESECLAADRGDVEWWDIASGRPMADDTLELSLRYLAARGLLIRHEAEPKLVRFKDPS